MPLPADARPDVVPGVPNSLLRVFVTSFKDSAELVQNLEALAKRVRNNMFTHVARARCSDACPPVATDAIRAFQWQYLCD